MHLKKKKEQNQNIRLWSPLISKNFWTGKREMQKNFMDILMCVAYLIYSDD